MFLSNLMSLQHSSFASPWQGRPADDESNTASEILNAQPNTVLISCSFRLPVFSLQDFSPYSHTHSRHDDGLASPRADDP